MYSSRMGVDTTGPSRPDCQADTRCDGGQEKSNAEITTFISRTARITGAASAPSRPCDGTIQVFRLNPQIFDFLSDRCKARSWFCHDDWPKDQDSALGYDIEIVGLRNVLQRFLRQRYLILGCLFSPAWAPQHKVRILQPGIMARLTISSSLPSIAQASFSVRQRPSPCCSAR
jgi:hypothetical protein